MQPDITTISAHRLSSRHNLLHPDDEIDNNVIEKPDHAIAGLRWAKPPYLAAAAP
jgi:hypothetical protein